ncbi:phosphate transport system substrate-binding protein [Rubricella aquisinus]|uniref:Phosphate transport system substrate-binding protein n=1 Tax=Rubricella aquisinus TaxID=2028108 RepID=A0A840X1U7_9RHOB|nr:phosphate ABC transporter substrate-binding/OmpA family protein [Rubricella aquisinus]MBB5516754.1 phosphate transport system substrate-binding protein [Rubricella aquisinus]
MGKGNWARGALRWAAGVGVALAIGAQGAMAQQVTLTSFDGSITLRGDLLDFDGESYRIGTAIGEISIDAFQVSCDGDACPAPELLTSEFALVGSATLGAELMPALIEAYAFALDADIGESTMSADGSTQLMIQDLEGRDLADVTVASLGSSAGFAALLEGSADIAMSSRTVRQRELDVFENSGLGTLNAPGQENIIGLDGLIGIVSRSNPVRAISIQNLAGLFSGRIQNWAEVGGPDAPVNVYVRDASSGTRQVFDQLVLEPFGLTVTPAAQVYESNAEVSDAVASDPFGIGFTGFAYERNARAIGIQEVCGIITPPTPFAIKAEEYPLARRLYLYNTNRALPPQAESFLAFIQSDEAQDVIAANGFIDQALSTSPMNDQGLRMTTAMLSAEDGAQLFELRQMAAELVNAERLSTTFRFTPGSSILDVRAQRDAVRLAEFLARGGFENKEILVLGFTDSIGRPDLNRALSFRRAQQVLDSVIAAAPAGALDDIQFNVQGFGEISPLGCNETFTGRQINRRVEVWVRERV